MPAWLQDKLAPGSAHPGKPLTHWREVVRTDIGAGMRNNTLTSLAGHLMWHGVDVEVALELLLGWNRLRCRPPLPDDEVAAGRRQRRAHACPALIRRMPRTANRQRIEGP